jgi:mannose-6-phosphate isomerase-like protein (cupin superfamily)
MGDDAPQFDPAAFSTESYARRVEKPWGYELHLVPPDAPYMLKIIHINKGARLSLQVHDEKSESWTVVQGEASVIWENDQGELITTELKPEFGYTTKLGQKHRLMGITDCDVVEASTPELGTTWRLEDDYARPHETPGQRAKERGESSEE